MRDPLKKNLEGQQDTSTMQIVRRGLGFRVRYNSGETVAQIRWGSLPNCREDGETTAHYGLATDASSSNPHLKSLFKEVACFEYIHVDYGRIHRAAGAGRNATSDSSMQPEILWMSLFTMLLRSSYISSWFQNHTSLLPHLERRRRRGNRRLFWGRSIPILLPKSDQSRKETGRKFLPIWCSVKVILPSGRLSGGLETICEGGKWMFQRVTHLVLTLRLPWQEFHPWSTKIARN